MNDIIFSVIIIAYKELQIVIDCLNSIEQYNDIGSNLEIIIIDNSPLDNIYTHVKENYQKITIVKNSNKGFGEANNVGAKLSKGKYLLFLNPDTILVEPIFKFAADKFNDDSLGLFGLKLLNLDLKKNISFYLMDRYGFIASQIIKITNAVDVFVDGSMFIAGADIFIRKDAFFKCGMFDENVFLYGEEADLCKRIRKLGYRTAYYKNKRIIHLEGKASEDSSTAFVRRLESAKYYSKKYNMNFKHRINNELRYNRLKLLIFRIMRNAKRKQIETNIEILKEFGDNDE